MPLIDLLQQSSYWSYEVHPKQEHMAGTVISRVIHYLRLVKSEFRTRKRVYLHEHVKFDAATSPGPGLTTYKYGDS
jgi:hypothetical protein